MSPPLKPKRTIRDISHHFLSSVPEEEKYQKRPALVGCYLTKTAIQHTYSIFEMLEQLGLSKNAIRLCHLEHSPLQLNTNGNRKVFSISEDLLREISLSRDSSGVSPAPPVSSCCFFFCEDDCARIDEFSYLFTPILVAAEPSGKDLTEVFKLLKGFRKDGEGSASWFLQFFPELRIQMSHLIHEEFNKVSSRFLGLSVRLLHASDPQCYSAWLHAVENISQDIFMLQTALAARLDLPETIHESIL